MGIDGIKKKITMNGTSEESCTNNKKESSKRKTTINGESCNNKRKKIDSDLKTFEILKQDSVFEESESESYESDFDDEKGMKGHSKEPSELTDDDIVSLCSRWDKKKGRDNADKIRNYLVKLKQKGKFDMEKEDYPGYYFAVTSLYPVTCCPNLDPDNYNQYMEVATLAIIKYNRTHETEFRVLKVVRLNCVRGMYVTYYMTFSAVTTTSDVPIVFEATVTENLIDKKEKRKVYSCKIKANK